MGLALEFAEGQTPLAEEEVEGLLLATISTRGELDEFEQQNIEQAIQWQLNKGFKPEKIISEAFIRELHQRMYGNVWDWAGVFRKSEKNIGVHPIKISVDLKCLLDDTNYWIEHQTYAPDEIAIRFKHRLVSIHCFANGNGRHSRLMADIIIEKIYRKPVFSWGAAQINKWNKPREEYLKSIKLADFGNIEPLIKFARS